MPVSKGEQRKRSAQKHAKKIHHCSVCGLHVRGNGGWSSHKRMHARKGEAQPGWGAAR